MSEVRTGWATAITDPRLVMPVFISCLEANRNAWIEIRKNGDQEFPIRRTNPLLDDPFNWTMNYGTLKTEKALKSYKYFNKTEKDLMHNWTACFGTKEAIEAYKKDRTISAELFNGGVCCPVRIEDAKRYRKEFVGDNYDYSFFITHWKPKEGIPYHVVDNRISEVFTICYSDEPVDKVEAIRQAANFMLSYAEHLERG